MAIPRSKGKSLGVQRHQLLKHFPEARVTWKCGVLAFEAELTPTPTSDSYRIQLTYRLGQPPRVVVVSPKLDKIEDCPLPHTYEGDELCLYLPGEWNRDDSLADTILPWASEWLANYETWAFTGRWLGGGTHPDRWDRPSSRRGEGPKERVSSASERP